MAKQGKKNLPGALNHPLRRRILRRLNRSKEPLSPARLAEMIPARLSNVSYHVSVLREQGVVKKVREQQVRGAMEHLYASTVVKSKVVKAVLAETRAQDERAGKD